MPLRPTAFGLSVQDVKSSVGWGRNQFSTLRLGLVRDPANGDSPDPPPFGSPVFFNFFGFRFNGLLHGWWKKESRDGLPTYEALVQDPREILEGTQVIVGQYNGSVGPLRNLVNAFGWWEQNFGFGASRANESGMPWNRIRLAVQSVCDTPLFTAFGGPLTFAGHSYSLDLSELPVPDAAYRIGGGSTAIGLLDAIEAVCDDGGRDFFVELQGFKIKVRTVSRLNEPPLGTIANYVRANGDNVIRSEDGIEVRNEVTSSFLTGGDVCVLQQTDASGAASFWGYDLLGSPITGTVSRIDLVPPAAPTTFLDGAVVFPSATFVPNLFVGLPDWFLPGTFVKVDDEIILVKEKVPGGYTVERGKFGTAPAAHGAASKFRQCLGAVFCETMALNASQVADIIGSTSYLCSTLEMRLAKVNVESWTAYVTSYRPEVAKLVFSPFVNAGLNGGLVAVKPNFVNDARAAALNLGQAALNSSFHARAQRLYEFVKGFADNFYGKKYLVGVPFVLDATDPETLRVSYTQEPAEGGWLPEDAAPLGLSPLNQDVFKLPDGRFRPFVAFTAIGGADLSAVRPDDTVLQDNALYMKAQADRSLVFLPGGRPAVLLTLAAAVHNEAVDAWGDRSQAITATLAWAVEKATEFFRSSAGNVGVKIWPEAVTPAAFAVALKSNVLSYGPWYVAGSPGKVRFETDPSLTPWNYGGWKEMNAAGTARVVNSVTNMQVSEAGAVELVGPPEVSLGDLLQEGGPNVTNIDVSYGKDGITTSYRFATYAPRFGVFSKTLADRIKRAGMTGMELRRALRASVNDASSASDAVESAVRGFLANAPKAVKMQSPHEALVCRSVAQADPSGAVTGWRTFPMSATFEEAVGLAAPDDDAAYRSTAVMSMDGLLRPFTTAPSGQGMPGLAVPTVTGVMNAATLQPFKAGNDITYLAWGDSYQGLHSYLRGADPAATRAMAWRGPVVVCGWGYDLQGNPVPGDGSGHWRGDVLARSDLWKAGPMDPLYDPARGVWTFHTNRMGWVSGVLPARGSGVMTPYAAGGQKLLVYNPWSTPVSGYPLLVQASYIADLNRWHVLAADCLP